MMIADIPIIHKMIYIIYNINHIIYVCNRVLIYNHIMILMEYNDICNMRILSCK